MAKKKSVVRKNIRRAKAAHAEIAEKQKKSGGQTLFTPERAELFCQQLAQTAQVSKASEIIRISRRTAHNWREAHPDFAEAWDKALAIGMTRLEDEGVRRAADGVQEPVFYKGERVASITKYSDTLLAFMLSAHKPEKYGKTRSEFSGPNGSALVPAEVRVRFVDAPTEPKAKK